MIKRLLERKESLGISSNPDRHVCPACFSDEAIKSFIRVNATEKACSYCDPDDEDNDAHVAVALDDLMPTIVGGLNSIFGDPNSEGVPWEDGEWVGQVYDTYTIVQDEIGLEQGNQDLHCDLVDALGNKHWCQRDFWSLRPEDLLKHGWKRFCKTVKHQTRFVFLKARKKRNRWPDYDESIAPDEMLSRLGEIIRELELYETIPRGAPIFRCRVHRDGLDLRLASELGPPPEQEALFPNRMSPSGIPMFYGAFDTRTCLSETFDPEKDQGKKATVGIFRTARRLKLLDLASIPTVPSIYDSGRRKIRYALIFLREFATELSSPISKDGREHIDYVPSQIVTEFFRRVFRPKGRQNLDGIIFRSAKNPGSRAVVLFCEGKDCVDYEDKAQRKGAMLTLSQGDTIVVDPKTWKSKEENLREALLGCCKDSTSAQVSAPSNS